MGSTKRQTFQYDYILFYAEVREDEEKAEEIQDYLKEKHGLVGCRQTDNAFGTSEITGPLELARVCRILFFLVTDNFVSDSKVVMVKDDQIWNEINCLAYEEKQYLIPLLLKPKTELKKRNSVALAGLMSRVEYIFRGQYFDHKIRKFTKMLDEKVGVPIRRKLLCTKGLKTTPNEPAYGAPVIDHDGMIRTNTIHRDQPEAADKCDTDEKSKESGTEKTEEEKPRHLVKNSKDATPDEATSAPDESATEAQGVVSHLDIEADFWRNADDTSYESSQIGNNNTADEQTTTSYDDDNNNAEVVTRTTQSDDDTELDDISPTRLQLSNVLPQLDIPLAPKQPHEASITAIHSEGDQPFASRRQIIDEPGNKATVQQHIHGDTPSLLTPKSFLEFAKIFNKCEKEDIDYIADRLIEMNVLTTENKDELQARENFAEKTKKDVFLSILLNREDLLTEENIDTLLRMCKFRIEYRPTGAIYKNSLRVLRKHLQLKIQNTGTVVWGLFAAEIITQIELNDCSRVGDGGNNYSKANERLLHYLSNKDEASIATALETIKGHVTERCREHIGHTVQSLKDGISPPSCCARLEHLSLGEVEKAIRGPLQTSLKQNSLFVIENICEVDTVLDKLFSKDVLSHQQIEYLQDVTVTSHKARALMLEIFKQDEEQVEQFANVLKESTGSNPTIARKIVGDL